MRIGVLLLPADPWAQTVARARHIEELGYAHLWTYDHLSWRRYRDEPWHATIPWLTGVAAATERIRLGTMVTSPNFRHPVTLGKDVMTLDHICGGRLTIGVGAGGTGFDATVLGNEAPTARERTARFAEFVEVLDGVLRSREYTFRGSFYAADEARMIPGCVQRPRVPLAVAATGPKSLRLAARFGDAWVTTGEPNATDRSGAAIEAAVRRQGELLDEQCAAIGRDPASLQRIIVTGDTEERPLASVAAFEDFVGRYEQLGFTDVVVHDPRPGDPVLTDDPAIIDAIATLNRT
ncbi:LLM class flavin-dependent oxidoreductase [Dactylosporangium matsuzakiense]|uniref:Luciferase n=1 Tax=Dactylosporangium matsuzakiense TaxID=53360 RepID=A0A9W6KML3_9ACTN|nr:LLM class flavin-dependent oxidoreductase [Dactylosporangium matsuzakiense]UWZ40976.1 LLM class flavin-dependent oxidoreductase [Dactylosporangium matsuzakiense]GLL04817.1 luciferase [Dactylosporangium matsuzakiense]